MSFNQQFDQHGIWRREFALRLKRLAQWMKEHDLVNAAVEERLQRLESQVRADKVMVAFVAEFSRGKSELINAIFFAGYGRRIMPASGAKIHAVRSVHHNLLGELVTLLSVPALKVEMTELITALRQPGIKLRLKKNLWPHLFAAARSAAKGAATHGRNPVHARLIIPADQC